jgi:DNA-binding transcriptional regulator YdaS (Cro superfamily)
VKKKNKQSFDAAAYIKEHRLGAVIARDLGITRQAPHQWRRIPATRAIAVAKLLGVSRHMLRPDVFPDEGQAT